MFGRLSFSIREKLTNSSMEKHTYMQFLNNSHEKFQGIKALNKKNH